MKCSNCGSKISKETKFCATCGAEIMRESGSNLKKILLITIPIYLLVAICAVGIIFLNAKDKALTRKYNQAVDDVRETGIPTIIEKLKIQENDWSELGFFDFAEKKSLISDLQQLGEKAINQADEMQTMLTEIEEMEAQITQYDFHDSSQEYAQILADCKALLDQKQYSESCDMYNQIAQKFDELIETNDQLVQEQIEVYQDLDLRYASAEEKEQITNLFDQIQTLQSENQYDQIDESIAQLEQVAAKYLPYDKELYLNIQQIDVTRFPNVTLYIEAEDSVTGKTPSNLEKTFFFIGKEDANGNFVRQEIQKLSQLDDAEALKINMLIDISGSMDGPPLAEAKSAMKSFLQSVQFHAGDMVELTAFSTGVYLIREFSNNMNELINDIDGLWTDNMTSLYDGLYTSVNRVAAQSGAKCVIAFTDGLDNYSNCTPNDVIELAQRYQIPIFIIGIGNVDQSVLTNICNSTGGAYFNSQNIGNMGNLYQQIYKEQKELYMLQFKDNTGSNIFQRSNLTLGYHSQEYGGDYQFVFEPKVLLDVKGANLYTDGPEAAVEKYIKGYAEAMTNSDFSYIEDYLEVGSPIYETQKKYITKDFTIMLDSFEIADVVYENDYSSVITTYETYYIASETNPLYLMTQKCKYRVEKKSNQWKLTDFVDSVEVLYKINQ